jgi:hypothetical protein
VKISAFVYFSPTVEKLSIRRLQHNWQTGGKFLVATIKKKVFIIKDYSNQGILTKGEGSVQLTSFLG